jgi:hypothetical protein
MLKAALLRVGCMPLLGSSGMISPEPIESTDSDQRTNCLFQIATSHRMLRSPTYHVRQAISEIQPVDAEFSLTLHDGGEDWADARQDGKVGGYLTHGGCGGKM